MCSWFQHSWSRYSIPLSAGNQINVPQGCLGPYSWGCKLVPVGPFLPLDCYYVRLHDYLSRNVFLSFAGDWNTSETYSIQCYFGKQSSHTKFPIPHSDPAVWRLSLVIRVSLPSVLVEMRNISNNGNNTPCYYNVISFQETWKERWKEWQRLEAFLNESVWEGPEERSHHLQRSGRWAGGRIQLLRQPHVTQRRSESCRPALSQMHLDRRVYPISTITVCFRSMCTTRRTSDDACMTHWMFSWPWTSSRKRRKKSSGSAFPPTRHKSAKTSRWDDHHHQWNTSFFPNPHLWLCWQVERQRRLERIKQKQSQLQELILQVLMGAGVPGYSYTLAVHTSLGHFDHFTLTVVNLVLQQIAFKNLVQRNRQTELQANRPPPPNSIIHLPFIIVNTSKKTVIDCSISSDKYVTRLALIWSISPPVF